MESLLGRKSSLPLLVFQKIARRTPRLVFFHQPNYSKKPRTSSCILHVISHGDETEIPNDQFLFHKMRLMNTCILPAIYIASPNRIPMYTIQFLLINFICS